MLSLRVGVTLYPPPPPLRQVDHTVYIIQRTGQIYRSCDVSIQKIKLVNRGIMTSSSQRSIDIGIMTSQSHWIRSEDTGIVTSPSHWIRPVDIGITTSPSH